MNLFFILWLAGLLGTAGPAEVAYTRNIIRYKTYVNQ
jgi:hypothetical protein